MWLPQTILERVDFKERYKYSFLIDYYNEHYDPEKKPSPTNGTSVSLPSMDSHDVFYEPGSDILLSLPDGVEAGSLSSLMAKIPQMQEYFESTLISGDDPFADWNLFGYSQGIGIYVPDGVSVEKPIRIFRPLSDQDSCLMERSLIFVGNNASVTLWWAIEGSGDAASTENNFCQLHVGKSSKLEWVETFDMQPNSVYMHHNYIEQLGDSVVKHHILSLGGKAIRHNHNVRLLEPFCRNETRGLCFTGGTSHSDVDIRMEHTAPDCTSNQLYKQILDGEAMGVFSSRIFIPQDSQRTLAYQKSNNMQLSPKTKMRTRPQLEIYADDVKCSHGATVGQLDQDALFYLRSRGIAEPEARRMLLGAFASEVYQDIDHKGLSDALEAYSSQKLPLLFGL